MQAVHWLHDGSGPGYEEEEKSRLKEVRSLLFENEDDDLGGTDDDDCSDERKETYMKDGIIGSAVRGEVRRVSRCCSVIYSYFELKFRISIEEGSRWALTLKKAAEESHSLPDICGKLYEATRRVLTEIGGHKKDIEDLRLSYRADAIKNAEILEKECCEDSVGFVSNERTSSRRRAVSALIETERNISTLESVARLHDEYLMPRIQAGGSRSHDANLALGILRLTACRQIATVDRVCLWQALWAKWNAENCAAEAEAAWLTLLSRGRKTCLDYSNEAWTKRIFNEALRRLGIPVGGNRAIEATWRGWPSRYRYLSTASGDSPNDRSLRKVSKLIIGAILAEKNSGQHHLNKLKKLVSVLKPYIHPSNLGNWTPRIGLLFSELCRELARAKARYIALTMKQPHLYQTQDNIKKNYLPTLKAAALVLAPLVRDTLYSRHHSMLAHGIAALRDLCGISPRLVAEVTVPALVSSLEPYNARLYGHQAPAALRACAALTRPLLIRGQDWAISIESDTFLTDPTLSRRAAYFHGVLPSEADIDLCCSQKKCQEEKEEEKIPVTVRLGAVAELMALAVELIDVNDETKTRCALLFFDAMLRWVPVLDDDDDNDNEIKAEDDSVLSLGLELGERWAPRFLDRLLTSIEHRDAAPRIPNSGERGDAMLGDNSARYANFMASARDAASAEMLRAVAKRFFLRSRPKARRRLAVTLGNWIQNAPSRPATAKDAASFVNGACQQFYMLKNQEETKIPPPGAHELLHTVLLESMLETGSPARLAFLARLLAGGVRSSHPDFLKRFLPKLKPIFDRCLPHKDKLVRKCTRKLLRESLRGLVETRACLNSQHIRKWPQEDASNPFECSSMIAWIAPESHHLEEAAALVSTYAEQPLRTVLARTEEDMKRKDDEKSLLIAVRQLHQSIKGACAALKDDEDGLRLRLVQLTIHAWETWSAQPATDAKTARALLKASRSLLLLRRSSNFFKARSALASVRARRRAMGLDATSREIARLKNTIEPRGLDDFLERANCFHCQRSLEAAHEDVRALRRTPKVAQRYAALLGHCVALLAHDYADIRGAATELVESAWPFYGWLLKPKLGEAIRTQLSAKENTTKSSLMGALALLLSRSANSKLTADASLGTALFNAALDWDLALDALPKEERDELAAKLASLLAIYASRHCRAVQSPIRLAENAIAKATQPGVHWRHAFLTVFVAAHALSAARYLQQEDDPRVSTLWRKYILPQAVIPNDEPVPRLALSSLLRRACDNRGKNDALLDTFFFGLSEDNMNGGSEDTNVLGILLALRREHRRERARDSDEVINSSPLVDALLREARHSESWAVFPKSMAPYSSRGFRSRHARFLKRLIGQSRHNSLEASALRILRLALKSGASAPASESGAAAATAAEAWAGALRALLGKNENIPTQSFFNSLEQALRSASPEHALCWADALRYAAGGRAAGHLLKSGFLTLLETEWLRQLALPQDEASWSAVAKWLALFPSLAYELGAFLMRENDIDQQQFLVPFRRLAVALIANADHAFHAVRERIGQCLAALGGGAFELGIVITPDQVRELAGRCFIVDKADEALEKSDLARLRRLRETSMAWAKHAARDGNLRVVAYLIPPALNAVADTDDDTRTAAAMAVAAMMHTSRVDSFGIEPVIKTLLEQTKHTKWRARCAVAAYFGTVLSRHALYLAPKETDAAFAALRTLCADVSAEVRDASRASFASLVSAAVPRVQLEPLTMTCYDEALKCLPQRNSSSTTEDTSRTRLGAVQALGATVLAFPYDVPSHVPKALVLLSKHHDRAHASSSSRLDPASRRHHLAIRAAVKHTIAEFKRTHSDTWLLIKDFFSHEESDALADILTAGDYLV